MLNNKELYYEELKKRVSSEMEEFNRKIEIGRKVKFILDKNGYVEKPIEVMQVENLGKLTKIDRCGRFKD